MIRGLSLIFRMKTFLKHFFDRYRSARFLVAGGTAAAVHLGVLFILTDIFRLWYMFSTTVGFLAAFFVSFLLQKFWTFQDAGRERLRAQLALYFILAVCNLFLNALLMYFFVDVRGVWYLLAQVAVSGGIALESFFLYRTFIFWTTQEPYTGGHDGEKRPEMLL